MVVECAMMTFMSWDVKGAWRKRREALGRRREEEKEGVSLGLGGREEKGPCAGGLKLDGRSEEYYLRVL